MKIFAVVALSMLMTGFAQAAQDRALPANSPVARPPQSKIDPAKEADIRHLMDVMGIAGIVQQIMTSMEQNLRPMMANSLPPGEYRDKLIDLFFQKFNSKCDTTRLLDLAVARYDESFSDEEIKGLITFYETPLGQKVVAVLPKLSALLQQDGQKLGQQLGRDSMIEVLSEHPDLAQALQAASHKTSPDSR